jgi:hypothetical protein
LGLSDGFEMHKLLTTKVGIKTFPNYCFDCLLIQFDLLGDCWEAACNLREVFLRQIEGSASRLQP